MLYKNIKVNEELYDNIIKYTKDKNISLEDLFNSVLNYQKDKEIELEIPKLKDISKNYLEYKDFLLSDTGFFDYMNNQSSVYNRLRDNDISTLKELFDKDDQDDIIYGKNKANNNFFIDEEVKGMIRILRCKYLNETNEQLNNLLNYNIQTNFYIFSPYPYSNRYGRVFDAMIYYPEEIKTAYPHILAFYKTLKSCGFEQYTCKVLIDYAFFNKVNNLSLGEFLLNLDVENLEKEFVKRKRVYKPFVNVYSTLIKYYKENVKVNNVESKHI